MARRPAALLPLLFATLLLAAAVGSGAFRPAPATANEGFWQALATEQAPVGAGAYAIAYDSARNRLLAYFGFPYDDARQQDVWALNLSGPATWTRIPSIGSPPTTGYRCATIYDPVGDRLILYGGTFASAGADLFQLNLSGTPTWSPLAAVGGIPPARSAHVTIYDPVGHRMIVYGGISVNNSNTLEDVWALSLDGVPTWSPVVVASGPGPRAWPQSVYDSGQHRLIVQGGVSESPMHDVWALSLAGPPVWTRLSATGPELYVAATVYDPGNHRMLLFGGYGSGNYQQDVYSFSLAPGGGWTLLSPGPAPGPGRRSSLDGVFDASGRFVVFSGRGDSGAFNDAWIVPAASGQNWTQIRPNEARLDERRDASVVWDPVRERAILYGGTRPAGVTDEVWTLGAGSPEWLRLAPGVTGNPLLGRTGTSTVWDPVRDRMLVFGGEDYNGGGNVLRDVIALSGGPAPVWSNVNVTPVPLGRKYAAAAYDPVRDRVLYFAGYPAQNARNQLWSLALGGASPAWTQLSPTGTGPNQRWGHTMTYDPVRDRMLVFGGGDGGVSNGFWALSLAGGGAWTQFAGGGPPARTFHSAIYDPVEDRLVIWGGKGASGVYLNDTWEYRFDGGGWRALDLATSPPAQGGSAWYQPDLHRMVVFGGFDAAGLRRDTWALNLDGQTTGVPGGPLAPARFALEGAQPNPAFGAPRIALSLPDGAAATLELIDVAGRRVRMQNVGSLGAGRHVVDLGGAGVMAPGLYFARLTRAGETRTAKVCIGN